MNKLLGAGAAALLTVTVLAGCGGGGDNSAPSGLGTTTSTGDTTPSAGDTTTSGGDTPSGGLGDTSAYCDDIKTATTQLSGLSGAFTGDKFAAVNLAVHHIADEAPSDIKGSWTLVANEFDSLTQALADAGLSMDDFSKLTQGGAPPSIDPAKLAKLQTALQGFDTKGLSTATNKIQAQVKSECGIDLSTTN